MDQFEDDRASIVTLGGKIAELQQRIAKTKTAEDTNMLTISINKLNDLQTNIGKYRENNRAAVKELIQSRFLWLDKVFNACMLLQVDYFNKLSKISEKQLGELSNNFNDIHQAELESIRVAKEEEAARKAAEEAAEMAEIQAQAQLKKKENPSASASSSKKDDVDLLDFTGLSVTTVAPPSAAPAAAMMGDPLDILSSVSSSTPSMGGGMMNNMGGMNMGMMNNMGGMNMNPSMGMSNMGGMNNMMQMPNMQQMMMMMQQMQMMNGGSMPMNMNPQQMQQMMYMMQQQQRR